MSTNNNNNTTATLLTLPIELVYRILDNLEQVTILLSLRNVCVRLNTITDTYYRYQVNYSIIFKSDIHQRLPIILYFNSELYYTPYTLQTWAPDQKRNVVKLSYIQLFRYDLFVNEDRLIAMGKFELHAPISNLKRFHISTVRKTQKTQ